MNASERPGRPRVVIVGAGMAGLATVRALARAPVTVQPIDAHNYTTFPPLLFQVATCFISPAEVARPIRALLRRAPGATFRMGRVAGVDWPGQRVLLDDGGAVRFDYLVLAPGAVPAFAGVPGAAAHAIPLKQVTDAPFANRANQLICMHTTYRSSGGDPRRFGRRSSAQCRWLGQAKVRGRPPAAPAQQASPVADWAYRPDHSPRRSLADVAAGETLVFAGNRCRCPLSQLAERYGAEHGPVTDS